MASDGPDSKLHKYIYIYSPKILQFIAGTGICLVLLAVKIFELISQPIDILCNVIEQLIIE